MAPLTNPFLSQRFFLSWIPHKALELVQKNLFLRYSHKNLKNAPLNKSTFIDKNPVRQISPKSVK